MTLKAVSITTLLLVAVGLIHFTNGGYVIVSPESIRPGLPFVVSLNIDAAETFTLTLWITENSVELTQSVTTYNSSVTDTIELQVPEDIQDGAYMIHANASGGISFEDEKTLKYASKGFSIYIQTDKAIYKPGQTINYRIFAVNPDLSQRMVNFDIEIKDPLGNLIKQWIDYEPPSTGVITEELMMTTQPVLGDWTITATSGHVAVEQVFTVAEYVLPKFKVSVTLPSFITSEESELEGRVDATYTFGQPVSGTLQIKITSGSQKVEMTKNIDGTSSFSVSMREFSYFYDGMGFYVVAMVTESLTGIEQNSTASTAYYKKPVKVEILHASPRTFKPGLMYTAYIAVTKQDGTPLSYAERRMPLLVRRSSEMSPTRIEIPTSGVVTYTFETMSADSLFNIEAWYYPGDQEQYRSTNIYVEKAESPSNSFIQIGLDTSDLSAGNVATFTLRSTEIPPYIVYLIISKSRIVAMKTIRGLTSTQNFFSVDVTSDMAPFSKLVAYYVREDKEVVVDVFKFNVDGAFKNQVSLSFSNEVVEPDDNITVDVTATGGSLVYILAVDQSVLLLKSGNDITQQKVLRELETFDGSEDEGVIDGPIFFDSFFPIPTTGTTAEDIFDNTRVLVLTDAEIYGRENDYFFEDRVFPAVVAEAAGDYAYAMDDAFDGGDIDRQLESGEPALDEDPPVRTEFPETWLWTETTVGEDGTVSITAKVPDTITSWIGSAFALSSDTGLGIVPTTSMVTVFKPFFVSLNLPYSVIRGETLALEILVFNYQTTDITAEIILHKSEDFDNIEFQTSNNIADKFNEVYVSKDQVVRTAIPAGGGVSVSFPIIPKELKLMDIHVSAQSSTARDSVIRQLLVEPEGVMKSYTDPDLIDLSGDMFTKSFLVDLPPSGLVEGSVHVMLSATGDIMGPTMSGLDELLRVPSGCGEQNMIGFAPDVFIYDYLVNTNQNNLEIKEKALRYMNIGYQKELTYQHKDGSFSAFGDNDPSGSTWLTAFVVKSFVQAQEFIFIDYKLVEKAVIWILMQQNNDGSFREPGKICHRDMQGGLSGPVTLTAYVLVALQEAKHGNGFSQTTLDLLGSSVDNAASYINSELSNFRSDPYVLAITTYALTLSNHANKDGFLAALEELAIVEDGMKHWSRQDVVEEVVPDVGREIWFPPYHTPPSSDIEMTAYGLLVYLARDDILSGSSVSKWLTKQRSELGGYSSTQDTVVALQALASYAGEMSTNRGEVAIAVTATADPSYKHNITINSENALVFQQLEIPVTSGSVDITVSGSGSVLVQFTVSYNMEEVDQVPAFNVVVTVVDDDPNNIQVEVCGQYLKEEESGMSIMEVGIPSGFDVDEDKLKEELSKIVTLQKYELQTRYVNLYLDEIAYEHRTCVRITAFRSNIVSNIKPSPVKVYNYYQPDEQMTMFYTSDTLMNSNIRELCGNCGEVVSLSVVDGETTKKPSSGMPHLSPNPLINIIALILSCFLTGFMLGVNYHV
ncbi:CD109 antigen-like [Anneissia japonica]|uniref:CD109 antigen-like n=1 Tax=Anneissia japonica TaxID=1529436 RepID=UPI0014256D8C|nr:CD109 antigen-like [Anneissia japonica]